MDTGGNKLPNFSYYIAYTINLHISFINIFPDILYTLIIDNARFIFPLIINYFMI